MDGSVVDRRGHLQLGLPVIRRENVRTVMKTLDIYNPGVDEERLLEFQKFAQRFEETAYATATDQSHYQEKISSKMLAIEIGETLSDASDWRISLLPESRERIVNTIMDTLMRCSHYSGKEELDQLQVTAQRFEENIYTTAISRSDYLVSLKMLTMGTQRANWVL